MQMRSFSASRISLLLGALAVAMLAFNAFGGFWKQAKTAAPAQLPPARPLPDTTAGSEYNLRFLSERVRRDPEDFSAQNRLAGAYLEQVRATGDHQSLVLALQAARASLRSVPASVNAGGLTALALGELANHEFGPARDHARRLEKVDPGKGGPQAILGDALLELGDYQGAGRAFTQMQRVGGRSIETETRQARLHVLYGRPAAARKQFTNALALALNLPSPPRETVAWCRWQLGETAFSTGDLKSAAAFYNDALITYPGYFRALASLGRVRAAEGDLPAAIALYDRVLQNAPDPASTAAMGDLLQLSGREREARAHYAVAEAALLAPTGGGNVADYRRLHARQLALFLADHNRQPSLAYAAAKKDYATRRDIYGADALAWTALKAGHIAEAQTAIQNALRLGTRDARLFYHAGMIARASGDADTARKYLQRALDTNPHFDPLQAPLARKALEALS